MGDVNGECGELCLFGRDHVRSRVALELVTVPPTSSDGPHDSVGSSAGNGPAATGSEKWRNLGAGLWSTLKAPLRLPRWHDLGRSFTDDIRALQAMTYAALLAHARVSSLRIQTVLDNEVRREGRSVLLPN